MQTLARGGYSAEQVKAALHASNRKVSFKYELLDSGNRLKKQLDNVLSSSVSYNALAEIKRTARFSLKDDGTINFLIDRIKPYVRLWIPPGRILARYYSFLKATQPNLYQTIQEAPETGGWVEFPLGVFILSTPSKKADESGIVTREVEAYDQLQVLVDDKVIDRYTVSAGTNYILAVKTILDSTGITNQNLTATNKTLPTDRDWEPGTTKIKIINDLLSSINYLSLWFDEDGLAIAQPYISPSEQGSEYTYKDDHESVIFPDVEQSLDLFKVANKWVLVVSEPDREPISSTYTNTNANSPTSTINRGRTIVDYRQEDAADQATLDSKVQRIAFEASQIYEHVDFYTPIMPMHSNADVFTLEFSKLGINAKYSEHQWSMELKAGARMKHQIRRVVNI